MERLVRPFAISFGVLLLTGCAGNSMTKQQKVDMSAYQTKIETACNESSEMMQKYSAKDLAYVCKSRANRAVDNMESYYLLYNEEKLISTCENENKSKEIDCFAKYQNDYYTSATDDFIEKIYPK